MHTLQANPQQFVYPPTLPLSHTLDDYRMHSNYVADSSFAAKAVRPVLIIAFATGAVLVGMNYFKSDTDAAYTAPVTTSHELRNPATASVPTARTPALPPAAPIEKATPVIEPASLPAKAAVPNSVPLAVPVKKISVESTKPVKAASKGTVSVPTTTAKKIELIPVVPPIEIAPPQQDAAPVLPPSPAPIPVVDPPQPKPAPDVLPVEPPKL